MRNSNNNRLMGLRLAGISLILISLFLIWSNQNGRRPKDFWSFQSDTREDLYAMQGVWTDQNGKSRTLEEFRGKVAVVSFVYTRCKTACPMLIAELKAFERELGSRAENVHFLAFILDGADPSPAGMRAFLEQYGIEAPNWTTLSASAESLKAFTDELRVFYQETRNGEEPVFMHTNLIGIIGPDGKAVKLDYGWKTETLEMVAKILAAIDQA